jgi:cytochrome c biogenesis protein
VSLLAFRGDLGLDDGVPQSVYALDDRHLHQVATATLGIGDTMRLPGGRASVTFTGFDQWATFQVSHDPGKRTVLIAAVLIVVGLILSLRVRRRRMWVRIVGDGAGRTVVEAGGLGRSDGWAFAEEFADVSAELRTATEKE